MLFVRRCRLLCSVTLLTLASCAPDWGGIEYDYKQVRDAGEPKGDEPSGEVDEPDEPDQPPVASDGDAGEPTTPVEVDAGARGPCDLSGSWLVTEHLVTSAIGARQTTHNWHYYEITQSGSDFVVTTGLACGMSTIGAPPAAVNVDSSRAFAAMIEKSTTTGRTGSSTEAAAGSCKVSFSKAVVTVGATAAYYRDLSVALPKLEQPASGSTPGWEDWDNDGNPGISLRLSGTVSGALYANTRTWTEYAGTVDLAGKSIVMPVTWDSERTVLGIDGSPVLNSNGTRDSDNKLHFVELARVTNTQVTGDDAARCAAVRKLATTLTPKAMM